MTPAEQARKGRIRLLLIGAFFATPFVFGWLAYAFNWVPGKTGNHGELLAPQPVLGKAFESLRGKWVYVSLDAAACDRICETKLYFMRQARKAQGKNADRVARLWIMLDGEAPRAELLSAIEGTSVVRITEAGQLAQFPANTSPTDYIYLVDPLGNLMMRYDRTLDPGGIIKDLTRLLRYSAYG